MRIRTPIISARPATPSLSSAVGRPPEAALESWVEPLRWIALAVFVGLMIFAALVQRLAGRVVWTVAVASLPLVFVLLGYHRWRRICPLAFFAQLAAGWGRPGRRRASSWLQAKYHYLVFSAFLVSLWLRLVATNGDGPALAAFLALLTLAAFTFGALYTGKTWCNYICPVSFVEKIYTEPRGLRNTPNSQCAKCTACKPACPDINQENGYWKEVRSAPKRFVYYAFPGVIFSFYFYYYLQAESWEYYFGGRWTSEPGLMQTAFLPGHDPRTAGFFFLPAAPRALAAAVTLALGALVSFGLFRGLERRLGGWLRERGSGMDESGVRHTMFTIAAFAAFVTFYTFAGAPTLRLLPWAPHFFQILVVLTATLFLARRLTRTQRAFAEETLARYIIRRWEWTDMEPPKDLHEAFLIHTIRSQTRASGYAQLMEIYMDAVREVVASGFVSRAEVQRLESLRNQLQISQADHAKVMAALDEEERAAFRDPARQVSPEKRLQLETYARALGSYLERVSASDSEPDDSFIRQLGLEYVVTPEEHRAVLDRLLAGAQGMAGRLAEAFAAVESAPQTLRALEDVPSPAGDFLADLLSRRRERAVDGLMRALHFAPEEKTSRAIREGLLANDGARREAALAALGDNVAPVLAERLLQAHREAAAREAQWATLMDLLRAHTSSPDPYVRATALHLLAERGVADEQTVEGLSSDDHDVVRETAMCLQLRGGSGAVASEPTELMTIEKMIALRSVPIFSSLAPEDLAELARSSAEKDYLPGEPLCLEGDPGDEVFVLLSGGVNVLRTEGMEARLVSAEQAGGFIGELAVLDPAPRAATVVAGAAGTRALRLDGRAFREILKVNPAVAQGVIRTLAQRLRGARVPLEQRAEAIAVGAAISGSANSVSDSGTEG